jgi:hypothetical protein
MAKKKLVTRESVLESLLALYKQRDNLDAQIDELLEMLKLGKNSAGLDSTSNPIPKSPSEGAQGEKVRRTRRVKDPATGKLVDRSELGTTENEVKERVPGKRRGRRPKAEQPKESTQELISIGDRGGESE